jgi:peptidyl-prolyl cis-trans isomerase B (cyclophilin B)
MLRWNRFLLVVIVGVAFTLNVPRLSAIALAPPIIQGKAAQFIVKIGGDFGGTGFFVRKNQNRYTILTNRHVIKNPSDYIIFTSDGRSYRFGANNIRVQPGVDLAEIEIQSTVEYPVAKLSRKIAPVSGSIIYTYGWNSVGSRLKSRGLQWLEGKITGQLPTNTSSDGYSLAYTLTAIHGLSGSPLLNEEGEVIGVYGSGEQGGIGLGIPIATYQNIALSSPSIVNTPAPINQSPVKQPVKLTPNRSFANLPELKGKATVVMEIANRGTITIEVDGNNAPISAGNFVDLVQRGFYNGLTFHRVVRQPKPFVVQGGDPKGNGTGGYIPSGSSSERQVPLEIKSQGATAPTYSQPITDKPILRHKRGTIAMARSQSPDSASSQFYFALADIPFLDGNYAVFGKITQGIEVIDTIKQGDKITSVKVTEEP